MQTLYYGSYSQISLQWSTHSQCGKSAYSWCQTKVFCFFFLLIGGRSYMKIKWQWNGFKFLHGTWLLFFGIQMHNLCYLHKEYLHKKNLEGSQLSCFHSSNVQFGKFLLCSYLWHWCEYRHVKAVFASNVYSSAISNGIHTSLYPFVFMTLHLLFYFHNRMIKTKDHLFGIGMWAIGCHLSKWG